MQLDVQDTIAAIATAPGSALRGAIRISGPDTLLLLNEIVNTGKLALEDPNLQSLQHINQPQTLAVQLVLGSELNVVAQLLVWPTKRSFTRQPAAEIHCIGNLPILQKILQMIFDTGARPAEPGEFTLRAFLSGRLDLTQAEAVLGLIDAQDEKQFASSLEQLAGGIGGFISSVRDELISVLAELEAGLDFVEEDIEFISNQQIVDALQRSVVHIKQTVEQLQQRHVGDDFVTVVLAGRPNAGKSSLFNELVGGSAIVSNQPGTTRDYLHADLSIEDFKVRLIDTAGLEHADSESEHAYVESEMQLQSHAQIRKADLVLLCVDATQKIHPEDSELIYHRPESTIVILTKTDLDDSIKTPNDKGVRFIKTSSTEGIGLDELRSCISESIQSIRIENSSQTSSVSRIQRNLIEVLNAAKSALNAAQHGHGDEIVAAEIRQSLEYLGMIVGTIYTDDILDVVFGRFCIGK